MPSSTETTPYSRIPALATFGLLLCVPVLTWWLVGDQSTVPTAADPDYAIRPLPIGPVAELALGLLSLAVVLAAAAALVQAGRRRRFDRRWWSVLGPVLAAGVMAGSAWRVVTAGVYGANIGAGIVVFLAGPVIAALLVWSLGRSVALTVRTRSG